MKLIIIIPAFNEEKTIAQVIREIPGILKESMK
jgi:glycosyltransferase involved in cell wall biosynthesis